MQNNLPTYAISLVLARNLDLVDMAASCLVILEFEIGITVFFLANDFLSFDP